MDLIPLDTSLVRGSHGRPEDDPDRGPLWIGPPELLPDEAAAPGAAVPAPAALAKLLPITPPASASSGS